MQRERADGEIEPAQAKRRQTENDSERCTYESRGRQGDPERRGEFLEQNSNRKGAGGQQAGVSKRNLPSIAREQHQRERTDAGQKYLAGEIELERRREEWKAEQH